MDKANITITIREGSDEIGFFYDIYDGSDDEQLQKDMENGESLDGGFCTSANITDAIDMASEQVKELILNNEK